MQEVTSSINPVYAQKAGRKPIRYAGSIPAQPSYTNKVLVSKSKGSKKNWTEVIMQVQEDFEASASLS